MSVMNWAVVFVLWKSYNRISSFQWYRLTSCTSIWMDLIFLSVVLMVSASHLCNNWYFCSSRKMAAYSFKSFPSKKFSFYKIFTFNKSVWKNDSFKTYSYLLVQESPQKTLFNSFIHDRLLYCVHLLLSAPKKWWLIVPMITAFMRSSNYENFWNLQRLDYWLKNCWKFPLFLKRKCLKSMFPKGSMENLFERYSATLSFFHRLTLRFNTRSKRTKNEGWSVFWSIQNWKCDYHRYDFHFCRDTPIFQYGHWSSNKPGAENKEELWENSLQRRTSVENFG